MSLNLKQDILNAVAESKCNTCALKYACDDYDEHHCKENGFNRYEPMAQNNNMTELEAYKKFCLDLYTSWCELHKENAKLKGIKTTDWLTKEIPLERIIEGKVELLMTGDIKSYWCESDLEEDE